MSRFRRAHAALLAAALLPASCASPPLALYTLGGPAIAAAAAPLGGKPLVIEVPRVSLPDYLDTEDILVRHGSVLERSSRGRWATRLSLGVTELVTRDLAARRPDALVTDQPQLEAPSYRVLISISRLDVTAEGAATLEADWLIVPRDPARATRRDRARFSATGPVATDPDVVALEQIVLNRLADAIDLTGLR